MLTIEINSGISLPIHAESKLISNTVRKISCKLDFREEVYGQSHAEVLLHGLACQFFKSYVGTELNIFPG